MAQGASSARAFGEAHYKTKTHMEAGAVGVVTPCFIIILAYTQGPCLSLSLTLLLLLSLARSLATPQQLSQSRVFNMLHEEPLEYCQIVVSVASMTQNTCLIVCTPVEHKLGTNVKTVTSVTVLAPLVAGVSRTQLEARGKRHHLILQLEYVSMGLYDVSCLLRWGVVML